MLLGKINKTYQFFRFHQLPINLKEEKFINAAKNNKFFFFLFSFLKIN